MVCAAGGIAYAADFGGAFPDPVPPGHHHKIHDWSGMYAGVHAGYGWGNWDGTLVYDAGLGPVDIWDPAEQSISGQGWLGGIQVGANHQVDSLVFGLEADIALTGIAGEDTFTTIDFGNDGLTDYTWNIRNEVDFFGSVRGRMGVAAGQGLFYATGGLAYARTSGDLVVTGHEGQGFNPPQVTAVGSASENHIGWTVGAGAEWMFARNWSLKVEYLYADLGNAAYRYTGTAYPNAAPCVGPPAVGCSFPHTTDSFPSKLTMHTARVGVNYLFGNN